MSNNRRELIGAILSELAGVGALALLFYYLSITEVVKIADVWVVDRVVVYLLLFAGPFLIFLPVSLALRLGPLPLVGAGFWALLGYVLIFVDAPSRQEAGFLHYVAFLAVVFGALGSLFAVPLGALGKRAMPSNSSKVEMVRALRQGALLSLFVVSVMAMSPLGVLNWLNALLAFTIAALTEFFFLARD
jgi:hypothetical protein